VEYGKIKTEFGSGGRFYFTVFRSLSTKSERIIEIGPHLPVIVKIKVALFMAHGV